MPVCHCLLAGQRIHVEVVVDSVSFKQHSLHLSRFTFAAHGSGAPPIVVPVPSLCSCAHLLVLTGTNCLSNIFMVNLNNRSNYVYAVYIYVSHRILSSVYCETVADCLSSTFGKYRVQCILQSIQYSNKIFHGIEQWGRISLRFLFTQIYILSLSDTELPAGTLLNVSLRMCAMRNLCVASCNLRHGRTRQQANTHATIFIPTLNIDMMMLMMLAEFFFRPVQCQLNG